LVKNGVQLVSITQVLGADPASEMMRKIMTLFDEYQSKETAKPTLRAMNENARQGFWNGARPPIGYRVMAAEQRGTKDQEEAGDRSDPRRDRPAHLPPCSEWRRRKRTDGRDGDRVLAQREQHAHPLRRTLGQGHGS